MPPRQLKSFPCIVVPSRLCAHGLPRRASPCIVVPSWLCAKGLPDSVERPLASWFPPGCALKASQTAIELPLHRDSLLAVRSMPPRLRRASPCIVVPPGCALKASQTAIKLPLHRSSLCLDCSTCSVVTLPV
ncbi:hypothetical protein DPMN_168150 [Dreissena polymorpha]|uniref:Uncharacterized protein n=1 Tax=Dreissena polymorpha TaxID=45954 RepID=A0A9D4F2R8_DREPO|nr:hypothetical protein DPMN_168150 [Dreissena polymorpha]